MPEIDERYRSLAQGVRAEADRRIRELTVAYEALKSLHGVAQPRSVFNEPNMPLQSLYRPAPGPEAAGLWYRAGIQPILVRLEEATGVSLATPTIREADTRTLFLAGEGQWHLARGAEALVDLVTGLPEHDLRELDTWQWPGRLAATRARHRARGLHV